MRLGKLLRVPPNARKLALLLNTTDSWVMILRSANMLSLLPTSAMGATGGPGYKATALLAGLPGLQGHVPVAGESNTLRFPVGGLKDEAAVLSPL